MVTEAKEQTCYEDYGKALLCAGRKRSLCEKYGENGTHKNARPSKEELETRRRKIARERKRGQRTKK